MTLGKVKTGVDVSVITHVEWAQIRAKEEAYWRRQLNKPNNSGHLGDPVEFYAYCRQMLELLGNNNSHGIYLALLGVDAVVGIDPDVSAGARAARIDPNNPTQYTLIINRTAVVMAEGSVHAWAATSKTNRTYGGYQLDRRLGFYLKGNNDHFDAPARNSAGYGIQGLSGRSQQPLLGDILALLDGAMSPDADYHKRRFWAWDGSTPEPPAGWDGFGKVFLDTGDGKGTIWRPVNELIDWWISGIAMSDQNHKVVNYAETVAQERARGKKIKKANP